LWFEASQGKWFKKPYLEKTIHQRKKKKRVGGVARGIGSVFKHQYRKTTTTTKKEKN
jgi:hypothetical protein